MRKKDLKYWEKFPEKRKKKIINFFGCNPESLENSIYFETDGSAHIDFLNLTYKTPAEWTANVSKYEQAKTYLKDLSIKNVKKAYDIYTEKTNKYKKFNPNLEWRFDILKRCIDNINANIEYKSSNSSKEWNATNILRHLKLFLIETNMIKQ